MRTRTTRSFIRDPEGGVAVEFVALLPAFLFLTFFVFDTAMAVMWVGTVEKAAQLGARLAVVSDYAVSGLVAGQKNAVRTGFVPGQNCNLTVAAGSDPCIRFSTVTCTAGSGCPAGFNNVFNRMDAIASVLQPAHVTISYAYAGLGFAGGPIAPRVTVTLQNVPYNTVTSAILTRLMSLATGGSGFPGLTVMPPITAMFTGEDLSSAGAP